MQNACKYFGYTCVTIVMLAGCVADPIVPVSDLTSPRGQHSMRVVRSGDTLYMIAWETGLDYRELAAWNNLVAPYRLVQGKRIRLTAPSGFQSEGTEKTGKQISALSSKQLVAPESVVVDEITEELTSREKNKTFDSKYRISNWLWPTNGPVIQHFTGKDGNNGVDISGTYGTIVRAAASGMVVYAGSGLRGYGQLLIIQHNEIFLSAYAHNRALLVGEGETVASGQVIAEMGDTDAESPRLHFEIRRDGKPVNPIDYLPDRSS